MQKYGFGVLEAAVVTVGVLSYSFFFTVIEFMLVIHLSVLTYLYGSG
jgi:hypothetical protein